MAKRPSHSAIRAAKVQVAKLDDGVSSAREALTKAERSRAIGWNALKGAHRAQARLRDIALVMATYPDQATSISVAKVIYSAGYWLLSGDPALSENQRRAGAGAIVCDRLPLMPLTAIERLIVHPPKRMTNREAAVLLGVTWQRREALGLRQIGASDMTDDEYRAALSAKESASDKERKAAKRRADGAETREEYLRRCEHEGQLWEALALSLGVSVRAAKAKVKGGETLDPVAAAKVRPAYIKKYTPEQPLHDATEERDVTPQGGMSRGLPHEDTDTRDRAECPPAFPNIEANTMTTDDLWDRAIAYARAQADTLALNADQRDRYVAEAASGWMDGYSKEVEDAEKAGAQAVRDALTSIAQAPNFQSARDLALALFFETDDAPFVLGVLGGVGATDQPIPADVSLALALRKEGVSPAAIGLALRPFAVMQ